MKRGSLQSPATQHDLNGVRSEHGDIFIPPFKTIHTRDGGRGRRQYLALFESFRPELPIKRVIVGPSGLQDENFEKAHKLLGSGIKIVRSDTPFIG